MLRTTLITLGLVATALLGVLAAHPASAAFCTTPTSPVQECGLVSGGCVTLWGDVEAHECVERPAVCIGDYQVGRPGDECTLVAPGVALRSCGEDAWSLWVGNAQSQCFRLPLP